MRSSGDRTRAERLIGQWETGKKLPVYLNYYGTHPGRWSGGDKTNWQNFSKVRKDARNQIVAGTGEIRGAIIAPPGHVLVVGDSSQIQARLAFWLAGQSDAVEAFRNKEDLYSQMATEIFGKPIDRKAKNEAGELIYYLEGFCAKTATLGCQFGMGPPRFKDTVRQRGRLEIELATARKSVYTYREKFYRIPILWERAEHLLGNPGSRIGPVVSHGDSIELPNGMFLYYHGLQRGGDGNWSSMTRYGRRKLWGGTIVENIVLGLEKIIIADQLLRLREYYPIPTMTHDELVMIAPDTPAQVDLAKRHMHECLTTGPAWINGYEDYDVSLPLACDVGASRVYRDAKA
jgi:DNA polymerase